MNVFKKRLKVDIAKRALGIGGLHQTTGYNARSFLMLLLQSAVSGGPIRMHEAVSISSGTLSGRGAIKHTTHKEKIIAGPRCKNPKTIEMSITNRLY